MICIPSVAQLYAKRRAVNSGEWTNDVSHIALGRRIYLLLSSLLLLRPARMRSTGRSGEHGFTLVELLVVMVILVLLASVVGPRVLGYLGSSRAKTAKVQIEALSASLELYKLDNGSYPSVGDGLKALVERPASQSSWSGPYLKKRTLPVDPWGQPYVYRFPGKHGEFDIISYGADKKEGGTGENADVVSW